MKLLNIVGFLSMFVMPFSSFAQPSKCYDNINGNNNNPSTVLVTGFDKNGVSTGTKSCNINPSQINCDLDDWPSNTFYYTYKTSSNQTCFYNESGILVPGNPLPVEISVFEVFSSEQGNLVSWTTESEKNNDFFTLYQSDNLQEWVSLGKISGQGNSSKSTSYSFLDRDFETGKTVYYRLAQTDFDGTVSYHEKVVATSNQAVVVVVGIYDLLGNPVSEDFTGMKIVKYSNGRIEKIF